MSLNTSLERELIYLNQAEQDRNALFDQISKTLLAKGIVEESYP